MKPTKNDVNELNELIIKLEKAQTENYLKII